MSIDISTKFLIKRTQKQLTEFYLGAAYTRDMNFVTRFSLEEANKIALHESKKFPDAKIEVVEIGAFPPNN